MGGGGGAVESNAKITLLLLLPLYHRNLSTSRIIEAADAVDPSSPGLGGEGIGWGEGLLTVNSCYGDDTTGFFSRNGWGRGYRGGGG